MPNLPRIIDAAELYETVCVYARTSGSTEFGDALATCQDVPIAFYPAVGDGRGVELRASAAPAQFYSLRADGWDRVLDFGSGMGELVIEIAIAISIGMIELNTRVGSE